MTKLKELRTARGISQEELAELVNVSRQTVSKWENGIVQPSVDNLVRLGQVFQVPLEAILGVDCTLPEPVPVEEVPPPRRRNYRLWAALAAAIAAVGIAVVSFSGRDITPISELDREEVVASLIIEHGTLQP